ncbi:MAG: PfkB family carbohydrate kinase [Candidatus Nitrosocaldus sp.]|nr:PfkB family carbohydrate kinase [Candidatus Nitrosocaldus sp.]
MIGSMSSSQQPSAAVTTPISRDRFSDILAGMTGKRVLIVGDLMLDHYVETRVKRLSREHLIPVNEVVDEHYYAGGAANLAVNIASLGGRVSLVGVVGDDNEGRILRTILEARGIDTRHVIASSARLTPLKSRYHIAGSIYFRVDREVREDIDRSTTSALIDLVEDGVDGVNCICVSDYDKGVVTSLLLRHVARIAREKGVMLIGQPRIRHYKDFIGFDYIRSTLAEAVRATGIRIMNESSFHNLGVHLLSSLNCKALILSRSKGLTIFKGNAMINIPFFVQKEYMSAIGIRDATMAIFALALASNADVVEASILSNVVAATATIKPETMVVSLKDVEASLYSKEIEEGISQVPLYK